MSKKRKKVVVRAPVFITDDFAKCRAAVHKELTLAAKAQRLLEKHRTVIECIRALCPGFKFYVLHSWSGLLVILGIRIQAMAEIQPVLELLEKHLQIQFDRSDDSAAMGWRSFSTKALPWFRVDAEVDDGSEKCRKVIVGYEQTPKYELRCDESPAELTL